MAANRIAFALLVCALTCKADGPRSRDMFDFDWRFASGDVPGAEKPEFDDSNWQAVDLPHDFAILGPFDPNAEGGMPNGFRPLGIGWYRKSFRTPANLEGRRIWLDFEGVYRAPKVWVNGALVAERLNGYVGFCCDITPHLKGAGQTNIVAVRADNSLPNTSRWYTRGGIYQHVWMVTAGDVHVVQHGAYVTTPKITEKDAWVSVQTEEKNESSSLRWTTLTSEIVDGPVAFPTVVESSCHPQACPYGRRCRLLGGAGLPDLDGAAPPSLSARADDASSASLEGGTNTPSPVKMATGRPLLDVPKSEPPGT